MNGKKAIAPILILTTCLYAGHDLFACDSLLAPEVINPSFEGGADSPEGWHLSGGEGGRLEDAPDGRYSIFVKGEANSQSCTFWYTDPLTFQPGGVYQLTFKARRISGGGGVPISGPEFCNRDLQEVGSDWKQFVSIFRAPSSNPKARLRFGRWDAEGVIAFDEVSLVVVQPVYKRVGTFLLGEGERIEGNRYRFQAPLATQSANHARPLSAHHCDFNQPRWVFGNGSWVVYAHDVGEETQLSGELAVNINYYQGGALHIEATSNTHREWLPVGTTECKGTVRCQIPRVLYPARLVTIRLRAETKDGIGMFGASFQSDGYSYEAELQRDCGSLLGETWFWAVTGVDNRINVCLDTQEEQKNTKKVVKARVSNLTEMPLTIRPRIRFNLEGVSISSSEPGPLLLPPHDTANEKMGSTPQEIILPLDIAGSGEASFLLDLGDSYSFRAETHFYVSIIHETRYGSLLPSDKDRAALWWASSGWKISPTRPLPERVSDTVRIQLAQNEHESAQFVITPYQPIHQLVISPLVLTSNKGSVLTADAVEILRVDYVDIAQPTDAWGTTGLWPDPLLPIHGPIDLEPPKNHPFWIRIRTTKETPPGIYRGNIVLEAENWRWTVPLEVEVFAFALPDTKQCVTAFGFDAPLAFHYHKAMNEADKRRIYDAYLSLFSNYHVSLYNPAFLDPIEYTWPQLPLRQGGDVVTDPNDESNNVLKVHDVSETANISAIYNKFLPVDGAGFRIEFRYKTGEPGQPFLIALHHFDEQRQWLSGRNHDIPIEGNGTWQQFTTQVSNFPENARFAKLFLLATLYQEHGTPTGIVWFDDITVSDIDSGELLLYEDFSPMTSEEIQRRFVPEFNWHRWDTAMARAFDQFHFNSFCLAVPGLGGGTFYERYEPSLLGYGEHTLEYKTALTTWCQAAESHLREKGWLNKAYVYWFDEPEPPDYAFVMNGFQKIKQAAPDIPRMLTEEVVPELIGGPTIWCPVSFNYNHEAAQERRKEGETIWWYICTGPKAPYATLFIDHPGTALRVWLWQTWQRAIEGILIWQTNYWTSSTAYPDTLQNPYKDPMSWMSGYGTPSGTRYPWGNGDGRFVYPPPAAFGEGSGKAILEPPVPSIRLEMLRDGIEDYEYLVLLKKCLEELRKKVPASEREPYDELLNVPDTITKSLTVFTFDPEPIEIRRKTIAQALETLCSL